jgi:hypothetical protein
MEETILTLLETVEIMLKDYERSYLKALDKDLQNSNFVTSNNRGFYAGMRTATEIEIRHLHYLLSTLSALDDK